MSNGHGSTTPNPIDMAQSDTGQTHAMPNGSAHGWYTRTGLTRVNRARMSTGHVTPALPPTWIRHRLWHHVSTPSDSLEASLINPQLSLSTRKQPSQLFQVQDTRERVSHSVLGSVRFTNPSIRCNSRMALPQCRVEWPRSIWSDQNGTNPVRFVQF